VKLFRLWPFTPPAAEVYGRLDTMLRRNDRTIPQVDLQIAAIALALGQCTVENWAVQKTNSPRSMSRPQLIPRIISGGWLAA
jgi:hypothetical protein